VQELYMYVERCGFAPIEALRSATSVAAKRFKFLGDRGRIAEGLRADLLLVQGDPTANIEDLCNIVGVWKAGEAAVKP
jgi:imidazolonepropionase-like amidohydrolase